MSIWSLSHTFPPTALPLCPGPKCCCQEYKYFNQHQVERVRKLHGSLSGVSGNSRSQSFPRMDASDSLSRTLGMDFFIPFPFPNFGNGFFSFPSRSRILGMGFFHSLPIPEIWEWIFLFPSRSRISGMGFFNSLPVPEFREWLNEIEIIC